MAGRPRNLLRAKDDAAAGRVAFVELFYDLVFVFAITQLSHLLLHHYTLGGALETALLLLAVWWVWIYTTWALNWLDPQRSAVRVMLYASMLLGLFMSMSIPEAFGARGLSFALSFVAMQVGRSLFTCLVLSADQPALRADLPAHRALDGGVGRASGSPAGCSRARRGWRLWLVALGIEYLGPWARVLDAARSALATTDWDVRGEHIAERCGLFVIICLGETLLISGATFAEAEWTRTGIAAFVVNFLGTVAMWWLYFHIGQERAARADRACRRSRAGGADRLHLRPHPDRRRHRGQRGGGRAGDRASRRARRRLARPPRSSAGRRCSSRATSGSRR